MSRPTDPSAAAPVILHVTPFASMSGANRAMLTLLGGLGAGEVKSELFALAESPVTAEARRRGLTVHVARPDGRRGGGALDAAGVALALRRAIRGCGASLVHSHSARAMRYCWPAALLAGGVPVLCHQRDNYAADRFHVGLGAARHLIAVSEQVRRTLPPRLQAKTTVVRDAVDVPDAPAEAPGSPGDVVRVGAAARCVPEKGLDLLVGAADRLAGAGLDPRRWSVEIRGVPPAGDPADDEYAFDLRAAAAALPPAARARVALRPFDADIDSFYAGLDVVVVPSRFAEPLGLVAMEAMARRKAVLVAGHGGLVETVEDGRTGLAFAPGEPASLAEQLRRLIEDAALRRRLGDAAYAEARARFTPAAQAAAVRRVYRDVFGI